MGSIPITRCIAKQTKKRRGRLKEWEGKQLNKPIIPLCQVAQQVNVHLQT